MESGILVVPVGEVAQAVLNQICLAIQKTFDNKCQIGKPLPEPEDAFDPRRKQYSAEKILQRLQPGKAERVLGVVDLDLYVPQLNFVFGLADPPGRRAVIALARLHPAFYGLPEDQERFFKRAEKEAIHELGHTFGLSHCPNRRCVMTFSNSMADTDYKEQTFCPECRSKLGGRSVPY